MSCIIGDGFAATGDEVPERRPDRACGRDEAAASQAGSGGVEEVKDEGEQKANTSLAR